MPKPFLYRIFDKRNLNNMKAQSQYIIAFNYGVINHEEDIMRAAAMSKELTSMLENREVGVTPEGEASTQDLMDAWYKGWDSAKDAYMRRKFPEMYK